MPAHVKANPTEASLLRFEAIVFVTKYLAHLLQQTPELGKTGDGVHGIKNMHKTTELMPKNWLPNRLRGFFIDLSGQACVFIPLDILGFKDICPSTLRYAL